MISFSGFNNVNFAGFKAQKISLPFVTARIGGGGVISDVFQKTRQNIPQCLIEDGISEKTFNKAKKFVMKSVNDLCPKESMVIINNGKIEDMMICGPSSGSMSIKARRLANSPYNNVVLIHSHPKTGADTTCPPSIRDWETLNDYPGMKSMCVIGADGEYAVLRKINSKGLSKEETDRAIGRFALGYFDYLRKIDIPATRECANLFDYGCDIVARGANPDALSRHFGELIDKIDHAGLTVDYVDNFWKKFGDKLNVTYESNLNGRI